MHDCVDGQYRVDGNRMNGHRRVDGNRMSDGGGYGNHVGGHGRRVRLDDGRRAYNGSRMVYDCGNDRYDGHVRCCGGNGNQTQD
jgi:hypothetical protein